MLGCPPGAVGARKFARLWQPVPACGAGLDAPIEEFGDIQAWRPEASMPGCSMGWLAWLGWLARLAGWLAAAMQKKSYTLDAPGGRRI